ncbi:MAG: hypothetical protein AAFX85_10165, partial [Pseudomonadota bacterium]
SVSPEHEALRELIPEYLNGQLPDDERVRLDAAVRDDPAFAAEVDVFRGIRQAVKSRTVSTIGEELGWRRLQRDIRHQEAASQAAQASTAPHRASQASTQSERISPVWRAAAVVLGLALLLETVLLTAPDDDAQYAPAGSASVAAPFTLRVGFQPTATAGQIGALLQELDGELVGGPGSLGLYDVAFADEPALQDALKTLREQAQLVETAVRN